MRHHTVGRIACGALALIALAGCAPVGAGAGAGSIAPAASGAPTPSVTAFAASGRCSAGDLVVGSTRRLADPAGNPVRVTGGRCFDLIAVRSSQGAAAVRDAADRVALCTRLGLDPQLNAVLGHGVQAVSTESVVNQSAATEGTRGTCTWSEDYLRTTRASGSAWRQISVAYVRSSGAIGDYSAVLHSIRTSKGTGIAELAGVGMAAERYSSTITLADGQHRQSHSVLATNAQDVTVLVGTNSDSGVDLLPELARRALVVAATSP